MNQQIGRTLCITIVFAALIFEEIGARDKSTRSLFSVVQFPNDECVPTSNPTARGLCITPEECNDAIGGIGRGSCASGFGVCCQVRVETCGGPILRNVTYASNPNYPAAFNEANAACLYTVIPINDNVCQIRLDFDDLRIRNPFPDPLPATAPAGTVPGDCENGEVFRPFSQTGITLPVLCGTISGQHMYIETGRQDPAALFSITTNALTSDRFWNIRVTQIECESPSRAPTDCLQYFTGLTSTISSFNFDRETIPITNQLYTICIRQEEGFCSASFRVVNNGDGKNNFSLQDGNSAKRSANCMEARLQIRSLVSLQSAADNWDIFCGPFFNVVGGSKQNGVAVATSAPFSVTVINFGDTQKGTTAKAIGFSLMVQQRPCVANSQAASILEKQTT